MLHAFQLKFQEHYSRIYGIYRKINKSFEINKKNRNFDIFLGRNTILFRKKFQTHIKYIVYTCFLLLNGLFLVLFKILNDKLIFWKCLSF